MTWREIAGVPEGSPSAVVDGVRLAYAREGFGPPMICLHAIGHGGGDFAAFAASFRGRFEIIRLDWPGQGRSETDAGPVNPIRYAELLRGLVLQLGLDDPVLVGCSIGGATAIRYASRYPVKAIVLANSGGLIPVTDDVRRACRLFSRVFAAGARGAWWFGPAYALYYRAVLPSPAARAQRARIVKAGYEVADVLAKAWADFAVPEIADHRALAAALDVPVLAAWAMQDRINQFARTEPALRAMKDCEIVPFKAGHAAFLERPQEFAAAFSVFMDRGVGQRADRPLRRAV